MEGGGQMRARTCKEEGGKKAEKLRAYLIYGPLSDLVKWNLLRHISEQSWLLGNVVVCEAAALPPTHLHKQKWQKSSFNLHGDCT